MYPSIREAANSAKSGRWPWPAQSGATLRVPATVWLLGVTSMLTDVSSEMVTAVLPLYLTFELTFTVLQFGLYDGLSQAVQGLVQIGGGVASDRRSNYKGLALGGYGASAVTRIAILFTGGAAPQTTALLLVDRVGKGIRTAPRDAMVSLASPPEILGRSFGVHRSLDAVGALIGPILAFAILATIPDSYTTVFVVSFCFAIVGIAVLALFVEPRPRLDRTLEGFRRALASEVIRNGPLRRILLGATVLGTLTLSDAFVFLGYRRSADFGLEFFPLLFTGTAVVYLLLAVPVGRLADRIGRRVVFMGGYCVLGLVYLVLLDPPSGFVGIVLVVGGLGLFYAATDGVLMAATSELLAADTRATGLAIVSTGAFLGRFVAAVLFGTLWSIVGPGRAFTCFALAMPVAVVCTWRMMAHIDALNSRRIA